MPPVFFCALFHIDNTSKQNRPFLREQHYENFDRRVCQKLIDVSKKLEKLICYNEGVDKKTGEQGLAPKGADNEQ